MSTDWRGKPVAYVLAVLACVLTTLACLALQGYVDEANIVMLFLLVVFLVAWKLGRGAALLAAFLSVGLFDFFFVPPQLSFAVSDAQYGITFAVMLAVGLITSQLTVALRRQADDARERERGVTRLYELARVLAGAVSVEQVRDALNAYLATSEGRASLHLAAADGSLGLPPESPLLPLARAALESGEVVSTENLGGPVSAAFLPLKAPVRVRGVLEVRWPWPMRHRREDMLIIASLAAIVVERLHYAEVAGSTEVEMASERLRGSILSALSHDLRTPLTAMVGLADTLVLTKEAMADGPRATAAVIREQARLLSNMVANLLDMARLQAGKVTLRRDWQLFEDTLSAATAQMAPTLEGRKVSVNLDKDLPLVEFDAVLMERVVCNLLENAAKYSPPGTPIEIRAFVKEDRQCIEVADSGPGFLAADLPYVFEMFRRGRNESNKPGMGLGLAICRAIVDAHGGSIVASNRSRGGASVTVCLPLGVPPTVESENAGGVSG